MIVDTSAIVAILLQEDDARIYATALFNSTDTSMSTANYVELINVVDRRVGGDAVVLAEDLLNQARISLIPFTIGHARWARHARLTFGLGRPGGTLNFGDCFAYALARETGEPLLFKGDDFSKTDIVSAL
jgi:ribonuclease VapC